MSEVFGDVRNLRPSEKVALERLGSKRSNPRELIQPELARRAAGIAAELGRQIGLLIGRDGRVTHVVLGSKDRLYLPDLGRFRLDQDRLRRLRLVVFLPEGDRWLKSHSVEPARFSNGASKRAAKSSPAAAQREFVRSPEIAQDLLTDLVKLRLDALLVIAVREDASAGAVSLACMTVAEEQTLRRKSSRGMAASIAFQHGRDLFDLDVDFEVLVKELESALRGSQRAGYHTSAEPAVLVGAYAGTLEDAQASMEELQELARSAGLEVIDTVVQRRRSLDPKTVIGKGKIEELVLHCLEVGADLLVFDRELTPGQLRSITNLTELRVIDRSMLILDIFSQRAKSSEGRLQVELAQLKYSLPRLTERDTGLSRLTGGIGGRGPGETKLEIGRRRARQRIADLEKRIEKLAQQRGLRRERRQIRGVPVVAIIGYTNAGKSTLLNALTKGEVLAESRMFATLDPSCRRMRFPNDREVIFVDTVGFIRELPKELVNAFRATLEEVGEADLLIHVVDASNQEMRQQIAVVEETIAALGFGTKPVLLVLNKVDLLSALEIKSLVNTIGGLPVSAVSRHGFPELVELLQAELGKTFRGQDPGHFIEVFPGEPEIAEQSSRE